MNFEDVIIVVALIEDDTKLIFSEGLTLRVYSILEDPLNPTEIASKSFRYDISALLDAGN